MPPLTVQTYQAQLKRVTWLGVFCNVLLASLKTVLGFLGQSHALLADGIHSFSDLVTDLAILCGALFWNEPPDEAHPYGHSKLEALITFLIGGVLFAVAVRILLSSIDAVREPSLVFSWPMAIVAFASACIKEALFHLTYRTGERINSPALKANAWHQRSDALSSLPVLIVLLVVRFRPDWQFLDGLGGILVSIMIFHAAWEVIKPSFDALIDRGLTNDKLLEIKQTALSIKGVLAVHALRSRVNGATVFLDMHILVDKDMTVYEGHRLAHEVRDRIVEKCKVSDVLVHVEPFTEEEEEEKIC